MLQIDLPERAGEPPETTDTNPHSQVSQQSPAEIYEELAERMFVLSDTVERPSRVSIPGTRSLVLKEGVPSGPDEAFFRGREFCHLHAPDDTSLHMALPEEVVELAKERGWAESHPVALQGLLPMTIVLVYGPRDADELETVFELVRTSHRFARGEAG